MRKLQDLPLDEALSLYLSYHVQFRQFCSTTQPMRLRYETIALSPHLLADQIATRLDVTLTLTQIDHVVEDFQGEARQSHEAPRLARPKRC